MTPRHLLLGAALLVAAGFAVFGDKNPAGVVEPVQRSAAAAAPARTAAPASAGPAGMVTILQLAPRDALIGDGAEGGSAFRALDWTPPPPPKPAPPATPPPPPSAPPLPFTFVGKAIEKGVWEVFVARGADTLIVRDKMVIDGVYRIDTIAPPAMTITYLPLNQVQQLNIGVRD
jgi:hypothetical protein